MSRLISAPPGNPPPSRPWPIPALGQEAEFDGWVAGPEAEETFHACAAYHSIKPVSQQGLSRDSWIEKLQWMVDEQKMEPLPPDEHELILAYLTTF